MSVRMTLDPNRTDDFGLSSLRGFATARQVDAGRINLRGLVSADSESRPLTAQTNTVIATMGDLAYATDSGNSGLPEITRSIVHDHYTGKPLDFSVLGSSPS